jgi:aldehyde:ferredoxin oxidoreductase
VAGVTLGYQETLEAVSSILGHEFTYEDYMKLGERVWNIERVFNVREGITRADDALPARLLEEPLTTGQGKGHVAKIDNLIDPYYQVRGWDENGKPTPEKLKELGLEDIIKHLN